MSFWLIIYSPYICLEVLRMMINYYRQNEMCTKNCYKNCYSTALFTINFATSPIHAENILITLHYKKEIIALYMSGGFEDDD